ncbi:MAG: 30S ribosome-binding factor RbfA [Patescibacteria group bacterium]
MKTFRQERLNSLIQEELNKILIKELEFDGSLVTLTSVAVSKDLGFVTVGISVIPSEKAEGALKKLEKFKPRLQHLLYEKIKIHRSPKLIFKIDWGYEEAAKVEKSLM